MWPDERWKSARRCGAKHMSKSKCIKQTSVGPLLELEMSKKCTPSWRRANLEVKMYSVGALLEVALLEKCTPWWCEAHFQIKSAKKLRGTGHFWMFRCRFAWQAQGIVHLVKNEQNVRVLQQFQKRWQEWNM